MDSECSHYTDSVFRHKRQWGADFILLRNGCDPAWIVRVSGWNSLWHPHYTRIYSNIHWVELYNWTQFFDNSNRVFIFVQCIRGHCTIDLDCGSSNPDSRVSGIGSTYNPNIEWRSTDWDADDVSVCIRPHDNNANDESSGTCICVRDTWLVCVSIWYRTSILRYDSRNSKS